MFASYGTERSRHLWPKPVRSGCFGTEGTRRFAFPGKFELPGREATLRKVGRRLILEPVRRKSLLEVLAAMTPLAPGDELPDVDETLAPLDEDPFGTVATSTRQ